MTVKKTSGQHCFVMFSVSPGVWNDHSKSAFSLIYVRTRCFRDQTELYGLFNEFVAAFKGNNYVAVMSMALILATGLGGSVG